MDVPSEYKAAEIDLPTDINHDLSVERLVELGRGPINHEITRMAQELIWARKMIDALETKVNFISSPELIDIEVSRLLDEGVTVKMRHDMTVIIATVLGSHLKDDRAENFVAMELTSADPAVAGFEVVVRRLGKKSTSQVLREKDERIAELEAVIQQRDEHALDMQIEHNH